MFPSGTASLSLAALIAAAAVAADRAAAEEVRVGSGSYTLAAPQGMKLPPRTIYQTRNVKGKMPTNDWWSSLAWERYSSNHFPHPLAVRAVKEGLRVSYPGANIHATPKHVFASMQNDLTLGHSAVDAFPDARVDGFSDWFVTVLFEEGDRRMRVTYGHGSPFVYSTFDGGAAAIRFAATPRVWAGNAGAATLGVSVKGRHYGLFGPAGSTWSGLGSAAFVNRNRNKSHFSLAVLPDARPETLRLFRRYAHSHVVGTRVEWRYLPAKSLVETTFSFETKAYDPPVRGEGAERGTIFALYPHQWAATKLKLLPYQYASIRGPMKLGAGTSFVTEMRFPGVLPALPGKGACDPARLARYVAQAAAKPFKDPADTYWQGKALGAISNLIPVAEQSGDEAAAERLGRTLRERLEGWFSAPGRGGKSDRYFAYDEKWGTLIGHRASYGSDEQLNDHHFHYGYFVRAAAELARADPAWAAADAWGGMVKLLIRDMAGPDRPDGPGRDGALFPFLRCFDPYAGHSWASGHAKFGDGNNQESSSEAMNAWTGVILWGEMTGDTRLRDLGVYLYTTELHAANAYWFDVEDRLFPKEYEQTCAALVWGGKTDYATWFSGEPEHVHGIILLPIQSGSLYLGLRPEYVRRNLQGLARLRGSRQWKHWHDTLWMYEALGDAESAMGRFDAGGDRVDAHSRPFAYHWIGFLKAAGPVDSSVSADCPLYAVFRKGGTRTYVAYNPRPGTLAVAFSDGFRLRARERGFVVKSSARRSQGK